MTKRSEVIIPPKGITKSNPIKIYGSFKISRYSKGITTGNPLEYLSLYKPGAASSLKTIPLPCRKNSLTFDISKSKISYYHKT
jgi:hypothetical protein